MFLQVYNSTLNIFLSQNQKVQVGNGQENAQLKKNFDLKYRGGKKLN